MKIGKKIAWLLLVALIAIQFIRPEKNVAEGDHTAAFIAETLPSDEVHGILKSSCYDCHSNNTRYPWYNQIAPISFWLADHIEHGKGHLNFSDWDSYDAKKKDHKLEEIIETVESGEMPLNEYTWTHAEAKLTEAQRDAVILWAKKSRLRYQSAQMQE